MMSGHRITLRRILPAVMSGSEGLAMLNATNRTLSANLNRLNLGTRNLAPVASFNHGLTQGSRRHDARYREVVLVRAEATTVAPRPSIRPISPKPIGGKPVGAMGRKRESSLGSSVSSQWSPSSSGYWSSTQGLFSSFGFSAFDLSTAAFAARSAMVMRPMPRTQPAEQPSQPRLECFARATQPARAVAMATLGRTGSSGFLEPSASS